MKTEPNHEAMRIPSRKSLIAVALVVGVGIVAAFVEAPPRSLPPDERIPEHLVIRKHPKLGGDEIVALTNRQDIVQVMTALPSGYHGAYCACFGFYALKFHAPTGVYRKVSYKPGEYLRDSEHRTGQSSVPRRFRRIVGGMIAQHELRKADTGQEGATNRSQPIRSETNRTSAAADSRRPP